jgi:hypothetical protein
MRANLVLLSDTSSHICVLMDHIVVVCICVWCSVGVMCPHPGKKQTREDWVSGMMALGTSTLIPDKRFPVLVHANYCSGKSKELDVRGLWLLDHHTDATHNSTKPLQCKPFHLNETYYGSLNWVQEYQHILDNREIAYKHILKNGTIVSRHTGHEVYLINEAGKKRLIPDKDTFENMGFQWNQIVSVPTVVLARVEEGPPLPLIPYR